MSKKNKLFKKIKIMNDRSKNFILKNNYEYNKFLINFYHHKKNIFIIKFFFFLYNYKIYSNYHEVYEVNITPQGSKILIELNLNFWSKLKKLYLNGT